MREDALILETRLAAQLPDNFGDYPDSLIRSELNTQLQMRFARVMVKARVGMLLKQFTQTLTVGTATYPLPSRAMSAGFEALDITDGTTRTQLTEILPHQVGQYETSSSARPRFFCVVGSSVRFYPTPNLAYTVRCQYYLRPSRIVQYQEPEIGQISSVDYATREIFVVMIPLIDRDTGSAILESKRIDIIRGPEQPGLSTQGYDASYEVVAVGLRWSNGSFPGLTVLLSDPLQDISEVRTGDIVRAFGQSDWPTIPHEYHPALAWAAAAKICRDRGMYTAAQALEADVVRALGEMADDIQPRVRSSAQTLVPRAHMLRMRDGF